MATLENGLGGRLPLSNSTELQPKQRELYDKIKAKVVPLANAAGFKSQDRRAI